MDLNGMLEAGEPAWEQFTAAIKANGPADPRPWIEACGFEQWAGIKMFLWKVVVETGDIYRGRELTFPENPDTLVSKSAATRIVVIVFRAINSDADEAIEHLSTINDPGEIAGAIQLAVNLYRNAVHNPHGGLAEAGFSIPKFDR